MLRYGCRISARASLNADVSVPILFGVLNQELCLDVLFVSSFQMYCGLLLSSLPALFTCLQSVDDQSSWNALVSTSESLSTLMLHRLRHCDHVGLPSLASSLASALCWSPGSSLPPLIISLINRRAACLRPYIRLLSLLSTLKDCAAPSTVPALPALLAFLSSSPSPASSLMVTRDCVLGCTQAPSLCKRVPLIVPYVSAAVGVVWGNLTTRMQSIAREGEDGRNLVVSFLLAIITELLTSNGNLTP